FRDKTARIEHQGVIRAGIVCFDLRQNRIEQIPVMNSCIENLARRAADFACNQSEPRFRVNWGLVLCENDQCRSALIQTRIHSGSNLYTPGERKADMHAVAHPVCRERAFDLLNDFFAWWNFGK